MSYTQEHVQMIQDNMVSMLKDSGIYGHFNSKEFVIIQDGEIYEFSIFSRNEQIDIHQIYGDKMFGSRILQKLLNKEPRQMLYEGSIDLETIDKTLGYQVDTLVTEFWTKYGRDSVTGLARCLKNYKNVEGFSELYDSKYKDEIRKHIIHLFMKNTHDLLTIPLIELLKQAMEYDKDDEYFDILKIEMECKSNEYSASKYIPIIAADIFKRFNTES